MIEYFGKEWEQVLQFNKLGDFDSIWNLDAGWFEKPNERRGGWSGVSRIDLKKEKGELIGIFLKRQENHNTKTLLHPIKGIPTFYQEFKNILRFEKHGIPTVEPVYFCYRYENGKCQAILMTKELENYEALNSDVYARDGALMQDRKTREQVMGAVARVIKKMHEHHFQHNCLYRKHIFIGSIEQEWDVKIIDLEKAQRKLLKKNVILCDLYTLARHARGWRQSDRLKFLKIYMQETKLSSQSKSMWRGVYNRMKAKNKF